jgi:sec-independent protein translocase protein TatB
MFDIAFSEMLIIAVVALIVLGPEKLPKVARTAGHLLGRLQRYVNDVKTDINREMQLEELKKLQTQVEESARSLERSVTKEMQSAEASLNQVAQDVAEPSNAAVQQVPLQPDSVATLPAEPAVAVTAAAPVASPGPVEAPLAPKA